MTSSKTFPASHEKLSHLRQHQRRALRQFKEAIIGKYGDAVRKIILFGSAARGRTAPDSDIDILVVVRRPTIEMDYDIGSIAVEVDMRCNTILSPLVMSISGFKWHACHRSPLFVNIRNEGVILWPEIRQKL